jgi:predicted nucleic acid-binding protein
VIALDASAVVEFVLHTDKGQALEHYIAAAEELHAPHLLDVEVAQALRKMVSRAGVERHTAAAALEIYSTLDVRRHPHTDLLPRIWGLQANFTAYDATYVALAESLDCPLLTCDAKLARSRGHFANIELIN